MTTIRSLPNFLLPNPTRPVCRSPRRRALSRTVFNAGVEASFKIRANGKRRKTARWASMACATSSSRSSIFPGFRAPNIDPADHPAVRSLPAFDQAATRSIFPQFTSIDSIDNWTIARIGVRNRLQTRRDDLTVSWLEFETYVDVNFDNPFDQDAILQPVQQAHDSRRCPGRRW